MKSITRNLLPAIFLFSLATLTASNTYINGGNSIQWHSFEWNVTQDKYFTGSTSKEMLGNFQISGMPGNQPFIFSLKSPFSLIYEDAFELMVHRNPVFASQVENSQRVSSVREKILRDVELSINRSILGADNLRIVNIRPEGMDEKIKGILGFGVFHRNQSILLIDNTGSRFAMLEELPETIQKHAHLVPMKVEAGYLVIPVNVGGREVELFFDGTSRPGLIMFGNRATRQVASGQQLDQHLNYHTDDGQIIPLEGFYPEEIIYFGQLPLGQFNVYRSNERAPSGIRGRISQPFFDDYIMIFDYKNGRFGIIQQDVLSK